jgi:hypothetical protein
MSNAHQALDAVATAPLLPFVQTEGLAQIIDHFINGIDPQRTSPQFASALI